MSVSIFTIKVSMSITSLIRQGISSLLNGAIIDILAEIPGAHKAIDLLKQHFTFTAAEIADNFQSSYGYALAAISTGLVAPENQPGFWQSLFQAKIKNEFAQRLAVDYLSPFAQQQGFSQEELAAFRITAITQCEEIAKLTLFQAENVPFSEAELAEFITVGEVSSMTQLVLAQIQSQYQLDPSLIAFFQSQELLGNALLFFLHEQLRREPRFKNTLAALQREELLIEVREIKQIVQATEEKFHQAVAAKQFSEVRQLSQRLEHLQQIESVTQTHYVQFIEFNKNFANWAQFLELRIEQIFQQIAALSAQIGGVKSDTEQILEILQQFMTHFGLGTRIKPRDELTRYSPDNLKLIKQAQQLLKHISPSDPQYHQLVIGLGSITSSQGDLQQAEILFTTAYQQANNDEERALSAFNLFQLFVRQQVYDQAFSYLQQAIELNEARYALHNVHTYTLQRLLGAGGMGCVFLARDRLKKKLVAIKCFWETLHGSPEELFKEAFLMAEIAGEYIPQPLDCGFVDPMRRERGYFVSEYLENAIDGETWLGKYGKLDVPTSISVGLQIAQGLQLAHDKGIFHLDLKPANILLQRQSDKITAKIIDFGLAKVAPSFAQEGLAQATRVGLSLLARSVIFGTQNYAPPEQQGITGYGEPGAKSDVYAFGKTLYRLLTGESPQTLHPRRLAEAPTLFELLCDCVEEIPERRIELVDLIKQLQGWLSLISQPPKPEPIKPSSEPIEKPSQPKQSQIVQMDKRRWWNQLDDKWKNIFKKAINIYSEPSDSELEKIVNLQKLNFIGKEDKKGEIASLEPLRALKNLQVLNCSWNQISDLEPLRALTNLQKLYCWGNQISDLQPLHALINLQELVCGSNKISDLQPLHALTNLWKLDYRYNQNSNLQPLHTLMNLKVLICVRNQISDLQPLRTLTNLQIFDCRQNQISDLQPLRTLTNLQILDCRQNQISDLEPLHALTNLQILKCWGNQISDLQPLQVLVNLQELDCSAHKISDLQPLHALINLQKLVCWNNKISDLQPLRALMNLRELRCDGNQIISLEPLYALTSLQALRCDRNPISLAEIDQFKKAMPGCEIKV